MSSIAIITARGGSKRIPNKNIKEFCGKPIISYSIEAARRSGCFDEIMVSTDSFEIAQVAEQFGASIPFMRDQNTSGDYATTAEVLKEVLTTYRIKQQKEFDILCCIYPTAPFVTGEKLSAGIKLLKEYDAQSVMPVVPFSFPPQRGLTIQDGRLSYKYPEYERLRSQDLDTIYHDCGQFYICKVQAFFQFETLLTPKTIPMILPEEEVQDIDNQSDWNLAEMKYQKFMLGDGEKNVSSI